MKYQIKMINQNLEFEEMSDAWDLMKILEHCQLIRLEDGEILAIKGSNRIGPKNAKFEYN